METLLRKMSPEVQQTMINHLEENIYPHMIVNEVGAAKGRRQLWITTAPPLTNTATWHVGFEDERLMDYIRRVSPEGFTPEAVLVTKGGGIARHRDAPYADYMGLSINLGSVRWHYERCYPTYAWQPNTPAESEPDVYDLVGGEIFAFNTKNPHWASNVDPSRWGINVWRISKKARAEYNEFMIKRANGTLDPEQLDYRVAGY